MRTTTFSISPTGGAPTLLYAAQPDWYIWGPEWSPDGLFIAFIEWPPSGASFIKIIDSWTGQVIDVFEPDPAPRLELSWARTQDVIAYDAEKPSNRWLKADVWALDMSDGSVSLIVEDGAWPSWSADDTQLVYQTVGRKHDVKVLDFATGESTNLTKGNHPDWRRTP